MVGGPRCAGDLRATRSRLADQTSGRARADALVLQGRSRPTVAVAADLGEPAGESDLGAVKKCQKVLIVESRVHLYRFV